MFKGNRKYYYILAFIFMAVVLLQYFQPKPIDWRRTYFKNDKIPFGCFAIFNLLKNNFASEVKVNQQSIYNINEQTNDSTQTFIVVNNTLEFSKLDVKSLYAYIQKGNTVFLCANEYSKALQDTFQIETQYNWLDNNMPLDSLLQKSAFGIHYIQSKNNIEKSYLYPQVANESFFTKFDTALFKVSAVNTHNKPVLLTTTIGKGKLMIGSVPDVFGNLFIVNHKNRSYTYTLLSSIKNKTIVWDEYYKTFNVQQKGIFQFIFNNDALYMAYSILILGLLFFMVFEIKRKQRAIPVMMPLQNSTLAFVDVISHVYFNSKNHKHIAEETIRYFYFDLRRKFQVNTSEINDELISTIHKLSGIPLDEVKRIMVYCENIKHAPSLTQQDLVELNDRINNFKQKSIR